jgi:hypothetical protein
MSATILRKHPHQPSRPAGTCLPNFKPKPPTRKRPRPTHTVGAGLDWQGDPLAPAERQVLHHIAETADMITVDGAAWLLVPAPAALLDVLADLGADKADLEPDQDDQGADDGPCGTPQEDMERDDDDYCLAGDDGGTGGGSNDGHLIARKLLRAAGVL